MVGSAGFLSPTGSLCLPSENPLEAFASSPVCHKVVTSTSLPSTMPDIIIGGHADCHLRNQMRLCPQTAIMKAHKTDTLILYTVIWIRSETSGWGADKECSKFSDYRLDFDPLGLVLGYLEVGLWTYAACMVS